MSDERRPARFETGQLPAFLDHIARQEAEELERLQREYRAAAREARTEARRRSREYHHRISDETRTRLESEHMRKLSRVRNELRRRRWESLRRLHSRARDKTWALLRERWRDPDRQAAWCRYWLKQCERLDTDEKIRIHLGAGAHESTLEAVRRWIAEGDRPAEVTPEESLGEGILIHIGERSIDGLLRTQLQHLLETMHHELAAWLHGGDVEGEDDEQ